MVSGDDLASIKGTGQNYQGIILNKTSINHELQFCTEGQFCTTEKKTGNKKKKEEDKLIKKEFGKIYTDQR